MGRAMRSTVTDCLAYSLHLRSPWSGGAALVTFREAELLVHRRQIEYLPLLDDPSAVHAAVDGPVHRHALARRGDTHQFPEVGASECEGRRDTVLKPRVYSIQYCIS